MLIQLVADYGHGDLAFAEVRQRLAQHVPQADVFVTAVPPFDTLSAGFCVAQLALTDGPPDRLVYCNVAPRQDRPDPRPDNQGEKLVAAVCPNGVTVVGVNSQHSFSYLRDVAELRAVDVPDAGSQFRSRDLFPEVVATLARGDRSRLGPELDTGLVPPVPERIVTYVDGYGNLKTTWTSAPADTGSHVEVTVGGTTVGAVVSDGTFDVPDETLSFAPGSSGWPIGGKDVRFYELLLRGGSAVGRFGHPPVGTEVVVSTG